MTTNYKFRRATHDAVSGEYNEKFRNPTFIQQKIWDAHGGICHLMSSNKAITYDQLLEEVRKDTTNYDYHPNDLELWRDGEALPTPEAVALSLVRLLEGGYVEMIECEDK